MTAQVKILYGHEYERCKTTTIPIDELNAINLCKLENIVENIVGSFYNGSRIRIQYRDDEGTFVTVSDENDVKDAVRAATPVPNTGEFKLIRLCLRVDDVVTPVGKACQNLARNIKDRV